MIFNKKNDDLAIELEKKPHALKGVPRSEETKRKISQSLKGKKKTYTSWLKGKNGSNHPSWKGKGPEKQRDQERDPLLYNAWVLNVKKRDEFACIITKNKNKKDLVCHHLNSWDWAINERYNVKNGVTLDKKIHKEFHKIYGKGGNNIAQFEHFLKTNYHITNFSSFSWKQGNHEPNLTLDNSLEKIQTKNEKMMEEFIKLCKENGHKVLEPQTYSTCNSKVKIYCLKHNQTIETTFTNYKKSKYGLKCCGFEQKKNKSKLYNRNSKGNFASLPTISPQKEEE